MRLKNLMRLLIGLFVLFSAIMSWFHSKYWLLFTAFIGLNLIQFSFSNWCLLESILKKLGFK